MMSKGCHPVMLATRLNVHMLLHRKGRRIVLLSLYSTHTCTCTLMSLLHMGLIQVHIYQRSVLVGVINACGCF